MYNNQNLLNNQSFQLPVHAGAQPKKLSLLEHTISIGDTDAIGLILENDIIGTIDDDIELENEMIFNNHLSFVRMLLSYAIKYGQYDIVDLIHHYTSCLQDNITARTAVAYASQYGHQEIVDLILNHRPDLAA